MKTLNNFKKLLFGFVLAFSITACKKQEISSLPEKGQVSNLVNAKLENDYLVFENYSEFFDAFKRISLINDLERKKWEKEIGFKSMFSLYQEFNDDLTILERRTTFTKDENLLKYEELKQKYSRQILFSDSSYHLNCSGVNEAFLANKDGIVKVGNDILHLEKNGIQTYKVSSANLKTTLNKLNSLRGRPDEINLPGIPASTNSFSVITGSYNVISASNGKLYMRPKVYNINSSTIGNRGFFTVETYAQHQNWLGIWRDVNSFVSISGTFMVHLFTDVDFRIDVLNVTNANNDASRFRGEVALIASDYLVNNPTNITNINSDIFVSNSNVVSINDTFIQPVGYWANVSNVTSTITAFSVAEALLGGTVNYPTTSLYW